ncbi:hypothetical protein CR513_12248, partial [Mucuna pruriens]
MEVETGCVSNFHITFHERNLESKPLPFVDPVATMRMGIESKCGAKSLLSIQVKLLDLLPLRQFSSMLKGPWRCTSEGKYGKILDLIEL